MPLATAAGVVAVVFPVEMVCVVSLRGVLASFGEFLINSFTCTEREKRVLYVVLLTGPLILKP